MKKLAFGFIASLAFIAVCFAAPADQAYTGEIMDTQCAFLKGHDKMIQKGEDSKACTNRCVSLGGKYVLYDPTAKVAYQLDDQKKAAALAGEKVKAMGSLDATGKILKVTSIKPAA
jgi:hypothetical protein